MLLTFTGRAEFNPAVDTPLNVIGVWSKTNPSSDLSSDSRVTIGEVMMVGGNPMVFESDVIIDTLDTNQDNGTYTLSLNISSTQPNTLGTSTSLSRTIVVTGRSCDMC